MATWRKRLLNLVLILGLLIPLVSVQAAPAQQENNDPAAQAKQLLDQLSPEEKVGQLFLVTFQGRDVGNQSQIYDLITNYHIGGVILLGSNNNFATEENPLQELLQMNRALQMDRWSVSQSDSETTESDTASRNFIPLFIGLSQEGDGYPYDQILQGLTPLPNEMAIGATWNPELAGQVGETLGKELSALGFNLLLGPVLDVLETPGSGRLDGLGTRTFGGDPFWVGEMGKAYIRGVHTGSNGHLALVAKHFPGNGGSDRLPEEEVATVRKSLEELKNFDLAPFFSITGNAPDPASTVDALLVSHIRYQGFQENIRATTRPVSFDLQAQSELMSLPALAAWRKNGGITISDNLGSLAVRKFYEMTGQDYDANRAALNAFLARNDLLYLGDVTSGKDPDSYTSTIRILQAFAKKYRDDPAFAQQVDESVLRILSLKYRLYPDFALSITIPEIDGLSDIGNAHQVTFEVARQAATLISPSLAELDVLMPDPPNLNDRIIFITDERSAKQCEGCPSQVVFEHEALQQAVVKLYGPQAGKQILPSNLSSYTFQNLEEMLNGTKTGTAVEADLKRANWIVFAMLNVTDQMTASNALQRFLSERTDLFQQKRLIVFAFNAPYYLDATNISKITAYYGLYSKMDSFVDVAARLLFREIRPEGALPISVPGIGYDLIAQTSPDPAQVIPLLVDLPEDELPQGTELPGTPQNLASPAFREGDVIPVRTGVILDYNGNPVPDGTPVSFIVTTGGIEYTPPREEITVDGVAHTDIQAISAGPLDILAVSQLAKSNPLHFEIRTKTGEVVTITPTPEPTFTPTPSPTPTLTPTATATLPPVIEAPVSPNQPDLLDWAIALILSIVAGWSTYRFGIYLGSIRWGFRGGFLALIGGLLAYTYLALEMPGTEQLLDAAGTWGTILAALLGSLAGVLVTWIWRTLKTGSPNLRAES